MAVKILIIEDDGIIRKDIEKSLKKMGYDVAGHTDNGTRAIELAHELKPDLVLMDIMLKGDMSGIEAAEFIKRDRDVPVIYLTSHSDDATLAKAKITEPHGYVIKPFKEIDLHTSIEMAVHKHSKEKELKVEFDLLKALSKYNRTADYLFIKHHAKLTRINHGDIYYVEALKDYVMIITRDHKYTIHGTMKDVERKLLGSTFLRVHRSFIVNLDKIESIISSELIMQDNHREIPIGGLYKDELGARINVL
ncbi:MAG: response regulator [Flavobacteriales bacterium]|nr:response regulator [Flavobacteriales bacterium]